MNRCTLIAALGLVSISGAGCADYFATPWPGSDPATSPTASPPPAGAVKPVAVIGEVGAEFILPHSLGLDASQSYDSDGTIVDHEWTIHARPDGSTAEVIGISSDSFASFAMDLVGDYTIELIVVDNDGMRSDPVQAFVSGLPGPGLRIEVLWDTDADLDVHLLRTGGTLFDATLDCHYNNCTTGQLPWAIHQGDNAAGGPEAAIVPEAVSGEVYTVDLHTWSGDTVSGSRSVRVYAEGSRRLTTSTGQSGTTGDTIRVVEVTYPNTISSLGISYNCTPPANKPNGGCMP